MDTNYASVDVLIAKESKIFFCSRLLPKEISRQPEYPLKEDVKQMGHASVQARVRK
jgi:hypothetical protein